MNLKLVFLNILKITQFVSFCLIKDILLIILHFEKYLREENLVQWAKNLVFAEQIDFCKNSLKLLKNRLKMDRNPRQIFT